MNREPVVIPEKLYFKIGEVCDLVDVQAHVLRYWETEFPQLAPQKNRSGQRSYRRRDVEISLRIRELLYDELYTIAGARKKLQSELRDGRVRPSDDAEHAAQTSDATAGLFDGDIDLVTEPVMAVAAGTVDPANEEGRRMLKQIASQLLELRSMLRTTQTNDAARQLRDRDV